MFGGIYFLLVFIASIIPNQDDYKQDWPDWRGVDRKGIWLETGIVTNFKSNKIPAKWTVEVSAGYSGPTVSEGKVYLTDRITRPARERVLCFNAETGKEIWSYTYDCDYVGIGYPAGPRSSVVIDQERAYSLGAMGHLFCFDKSSGKVLWQKDLNDEYKIRMPIWGIASAPLVFEDLLILNIGGSDNACAVALNKYDGNEIWKNLDDDASYVAPVLIDQAGKKVLIFWTGQRILGMNPKNGEVFWHNKFEQKRMIMNISTPVYRNGYLFISSFFDGSMLLKLHSNQLDASVVWQRSGKNERNTDALHCCISTPVLTDSYIFGVDSYGELRCLELKTGDRVWEDLTAVKKARWANIHFIQNEELYYMFNENGELIIARLSGEAYEEVSRAKLIEPTKDQLNRSGEGVTWAHPAFANKHIYVRSDKELVCADLSAK